MKLYILTLLTNVVCRSFPNVLIGIVAMPDHDLEQNQWINDVPHFFVTNTTHPRVQLDPGCRWPGKSPDEMKMISVLSQCYDRMLADPKQELEWCLIADADGYFILSSLVPWLKQHFDASEPHYLGYWPWTTTSNWNPLTPPEWPGSHRRIFCNGPEFPLAYTRADFGYGGAGQIVSVGALRKLGRTALDECLGWLACGNMDARVGTCLYQGGRPNGVAMTDIRLAHPSGVGRLMSLHRHSLEEAFQLEVANAMPLDWNRNGLGTTPGWQEKERLWASQASQPGLVWAAIALLGPLESRLMDGVTQALTTLARRVGVAMIKRRAPDQSQNRTIMVIGTLADMQWRSVRPWIVVVESPMGVALTQFYRDNIGVVLQQRFQLNRTVSLFEVLATPGLCHQYLALPQVVDSINNVVRVFSAITQMVVEMLPAWHFCPGSFQSKDERPIAQWDQEAQMLVQTFRKAAKGKRQIIVVQSHRLDDSMTLLRRRLYMSELAFMLPTGIRAGRHGNWDQASEGKDGSIARRGRTVLNRIWEPTIALNHALMESFEQDMRMYQLDDAVVGTSEQTGATSGP